MAEENLNSNPIIETNDNDPRNILHRMRAVLNFMAIAVTEEIVLDSDEARFGACLILQSCEEAAKHAEGLLDAEVEAWRAAGSPPRPVPCAVS